jgi:hypothetical protein
MANAGPSCSPSCCHGRNNPYARLPGDRAAATEACFRRGKSGLHGITVPGNARRGDASHFRASATESKPPALGRVRSKGCGKSAPRVRQRTRHGKPHRVQDRIGAAHGLFPARRPGWLLEAEGNFRPRGMVAQVPQGTGQNPAYRSPGNFVESENGQAYTIRRLGFPPLAPLRNQRPCGDARAVVRPRRL